MRKFIAIVSVLAMLIGFIPLTAQPVQASEALSTANPYQVGYARVDINPYVVEDDPSSGVMALPLRGYGDNWNRLSTDGLLDDSGDGCIDENDGLSATCIAISDAEGNAVLLYTIDLLGGDMAKQARPIIMERVNAALESGELTDLQPLTQNQIQISGTHTHSGIAAPSYSSSGKTGTNDDGVDLSVVNENLGVWINRTNADLADAAIAALKDRSAAQVSKDQLSVGEATSDVISGKRLNSTRHYNMEVDGDKFVGGNGFNAVDKWDYENPDDYRTPRGVDPKAVTKADDTMYILRFDFPTSEKLPVLMVSWRGHATINGGYHDNIISSDYVNSFCRALEYGCQVNFDSTNGYITGWQMGSTQKYRAAFFQATGGNVNLGCDELITYSGSEGDVEQYADQWLYAAAYPTGNEARSCTYGVVLAQLALECISDGLNESPVENGNIRSKHMTCYAPWKTSNISKLGYEAALVYQAANAIKTVGVPYKYTSPETGEIFLISSRFHASNLTSSWNVNLDAPKTGTDKLTLSAFTLGDDVAFLTMPGEPFDFYMKDSELTGEALYAPENNLWNDLVDDNTYGKPFVLGYCSAAEGYLPNTASFDYNKGSTKWATGSYESHSTHFEKGTGETMVRIYDQMLTALAYSEGDMSYTASCAHCGENQLWQPYNAQTTLTTGHYYLLSDVHTDTIKISGGQNVCIDLKGHTLFGESRAITLTDSNKDVLNIMDSSQEQTGTIQGCGALYGAARGVYAGTISIAAADELNLYSGTLTAYERTAYSATRGGVAYISGVFNMYGGQITGGTASSFTGTYYSNGAVSASKSGYGGCIYNAGTCNFFGGTVTGGQVTTITGTVTESDTDYTYSQDETPKQDRGDCVWSSAAAAVSLGGDARVEHLRFADDDGLNIVGVYTGTVEVEFNTLAELQDMTVVGSCEGNADVSDADITFTDTPGKTAAVRGSELVISDLPYSYTSCRACGECRWIPVSEADMKAVGENGLTPGHYRLTEDMTVGMRRLNKNEDKPGSYCIDLNGHIYTGASRPFTVYKDAELNIFDSIGDGAVVGKCAANAYGSAIYLYSGSVAALYGGTLRHGASNSVADGGIVCVAGGHFSLHGGIIEGTAVSGKGGAISISSAGSFTATGGKVTAGTAETAGTCVYVNKNSKVSLSGNANIAQIFSSTVGDLTVDGSYTGSVELAYPTSVEVGTVLGVISPEGNLAEAKISVAENCKTAAASGDGLTVQYAHSYETVTQDATCIAQGSVILTCTVCGDTNHTVIPAVGHSDEIQVTAPTCTEPGYSTYTCSVCGDIRVGNETPAVGHHYIGGVCQRCSLCQACGESQWTLLTATDLGTSLKSGHYRLTESIEAAQVTVSGDCCIDLAGNTLTGTTRALYVASGASLNILDSVGCGILEGKSGASVTGGVIYIYTDAVVSLYGGTLRHNTANSETVTTGGVICISGSTFNLYGGTVKGAKVTGYGGAIMVSGRGGRDGVLNITGGTVTSGTAAGGGACVYVNTGCSVSLSGNAFVENIRFVKGSEDALKLIGPFSGQTVLQYPSTVILSQGTVVGQADAAELIRGDITVANSPCIDVVLSDDVLVIDVAHRYEHGNCTTCGAEDPDYVKPVVIPTLTLKAPTLEFKDMITVNAMFTAENIEDVVEMGMITYTEQVTEWNVETAKHVIPGTTYDVNTGRYIAASQGIHAKYLGDTVYLACYAKLTDGSYVYTKLASYSPVQYATSKLKGTDAKLKQLVVAMLNYGAAAQLHFQHNVENLANSTLTAEQIALPESYRSDMVSTVASPSAEKQGAFANNKGFAKKYPSISFEGAFCINYFFTPNYAPVDGVTLYYWNAADYEAADVLTVENATGSLKLDGEGTAQYRGDITGIAAKALSEATYVAAVYSDGTTEWTSGVLGYSIGSYCASQSTKGGTIADLAMATAVYGYQAKAYFG